MFKIGEFSRFTRVSIKMLRRYDEIGLLRPSFVERSTGYRYYAAEQLPRLNRIIALKDLGFSLEAIAALLDERDEAARGRLIAGRREELMQSMERDAARLRQLEALEVGRWPELGRHDVVLRAVPAVCSATIRRRVASLGGPVTALFEALEVHAARRQARAPASPLLIFHDEEYRETDLDVEAAVPLAHRVDADGDVQVREVEGWPTMACVVYRGDYEQMGQVLQVLLTWTALHDMRVAGPIREVYLRFGADQDGYRLPRPFLASEAEDFVTEVQVPVARGGGP